MGIDTRITIDELNAKNKFQMTAHLGIEFTEITENSLSGKMPVDERTRQPLGLLHGGANAVLAETLGSMGAYLCLDRSNFYCVGLELKCNHLRGVMHGFVYGKAKPLHIGRSTQLWEIEIRNEEGKLSCFSTLTMAVKPLSEEMKKIHAPIFLSTENS